MVKLRSKASTHLPPAPAAQDMAGPSVSNVILVIEGAAPFTGHVPQPFSVMPKLNGQPEGCPCYRLVTCCQVLEQSEQDTWRNCT